MPTAHSTAKTNGRKSPLSPADVRQIIELKKAGQPQRAIAAQFGISQQAVSQLLSKLRRSQAPQREPLFPLWLHKATGQYAKKIRGKVYYFGADAAAALQRYNMEREQLERGEVPEVRRTDPTVKYICDHFLTDRQARLKSGEITQRTFDDYLAACNRLADYFGRNTFVHDLDANRFAAYRAELAGRVGPTTLCGEIGRVRCVFNHAYDSEILDRPVRWGKSFRKPSKRTLRVHRANQNRKFLEAHEIHAVMKVAGDNLKAMILLAANCGLGNHDCAGLLTTHIKDGWLHYPRPKTGIERTCPLWPQTLEAVEDIIDRRPTLRDAELEDFVFLTKYRQPWTGKGRANPISAQFRKALEAANCYRRGIGFYALRHVFETVAGGARDQVAVNHVMGHVDGTMAAEYREHIEPARLQAVVDHVRNWLFEVTDE